MDFIRWLFSPPSLNRFEIVAVLLLASYWADGSLTWYIAILLAVVFILVSTFIEIKLGK